MRIRCSEDVDKLQHSWTFRTTKGTIPYSPYRVDQQLCFSISPFFPFLFLFFFVFVMKLSLKLVRLIENREQLEIFSRLPILSQPKECYIRQHFKKSLCSVSNILYRVLVTTIHSNGNNPKLKSRVTNVFRGVYTFFPSSES